MQNEAVRACKDCELLLLRSLKQDRIEMRGLLGSDSFSRCQKLANPAKLEPEFLAVLHHVNAKNHQI